MIPGEHLGGYLHSVLVQNVLYTGQQVSRARRGRCVGLLLTLHYYFGDLGDLDGEKVPRALDLIDPQVAVVGDCQQVRPQIAGRAMGGGVGLLNGLVFLGSSTSKLLSVPEGCTPGISGHSLLVGQRPRPHPAHLRLVTAELHGDASEVDRGRVDNREVGLVR